MTSLLEKLYKTILFDKKIKKIKIQKRIKNMTKELFDKAKDLLETIEVKNKEADILEKRAERFAAYIDWMDGRRQPIKANGKTYRKVEIKFNMSARPTEVSVDDLFDLVEENKKEFVDFLQKCQKNYLKKTKENKSQVEKLWQEFDSLKDENCKEAESA